MKVLFLEIATERDWALSSIGPACLAAYLRQHGHEAVLHVVEADEPLEVTLAAIAAHAPGLLGLSMTTRQWLRGAQVVKDLRERIDIPVVAGGLHPTFSSDQVVEAPGFDYVCLGEGEGALLDLVEHLQNKGPVAEDAIENIRVRGGGRPLLRPPVPELDKLPWLARDMLSERHGVVYMVTQRGCPFLCTYCAARMYNEMYDNYGRRRSQESVREEIRALRADGATYLIFLDDTFTLHRQWVKEFCDLHEADGSMPFSLHARVETMSQPMIEQLARAGCKHITYGVESGSDRVRREVMKRMVSNEKLIDVFRRTREAGILTTANYILGTPGETCAEVEETLALHELLEPDDFGYFVFYPYPGTPLFKTVKDMGLLPDDWQTRPANHRQSILNLPDMTPEDVSRYYDLFTQARERHYFKKYGMQIGESGRQTVKEGYDHCATTG